MSWRDNIQICMDVPTEVCNAKGGNCDECSIDRVLEALKASGCISSQSLRNVEGAIGWKNLKDGFWYFIPEEA